MYIYVCVWLWVCVYVYIYVYLLECAAVGEVALGHQVHI